jgi:DME family drug/metabolite transporter
VPVSRLAVLAAAVLFSTGGAAIKGCSLSGFAVAGLRSAFAAVVLLAFTPAVRGPWNGRTIVVAAVYCVMMLLFVVGNKLTTAANTIFLQSAAPLYVMLLGPWLLGEPVRRQDLVMIVLMGCGLAMFFVGSDVPSVTAPNPATGNVVAVLGGVAWAATIVGVRWLGAEGRDGSAAPALVLGNVMAFVACLPWTPSPASISTSDWLVLAYLGLFQVGLAYVFLRIGLHRVPALEASLLLLLEPVLNPVWAWIVQGEVPGPWSIGGGVVILAVTVVKTFRDAVQRGVLGDARTAP